MVCLICVDASRRSKPALRRPISPLCCCRVLNTGDKPISPHTGAAGVVTHFYHRTFTSNLSAYGNQRNEITLWGASGITVLWDWCFSFLHRFASAWASGFTEEKTKQNKTKTCRFWRIAYQQKKVKLLNLKQYRTRGNLCLEEFTLIFLFSGTKKISRSQTADLKETCFHLTVLTANCWSTPYVSTFVPSYHGYPWNTWGKTCGDK